MSRSYKKHLWIRLKGDSSKEGKRLANKRIRHKTDVPDGRAYRKYYDQWNICDGQYLYDPRPRWYNWGQEWFYPDPVWKVRMKQNYCGVQVVWLTGKAHNLPIVGSNPTPASI